MSLAGKCQLKELALQAEAAEVELWATAQAVVLVDSTSAALHSQSIWCCHQTWDTKVHISLRWSYWGNLSSMCRCGGVPHMSVEWKNG